MISMQNAKDAIWDDVLKCVAVSTKTGEYSVLKELPDETGAESSLMRAENIFQYWQALIEQQIIHPDDSTELASNLHEVISLDKKEDLPVGRSQSILRYRIGGEYRWVVIDAIYPTIPESGEIVCVVTMRAGDPEKFGAIASSSSAAISVMNAFQKILKVNIANDTFEVIKISDDEKHAIPADASLSTWFRSFASANNIHPHDVEVFTNFTDLARIRRSFEAALSPLRCRYRRLIGSDWRWVLMELVPSIDFSSASPTVMLYIKDIDNTRFSAPHESSSLPGVKDAAEFEAYIADRAAHHGFSKSEGMGIIKASLPLMPYLISARGKAAGDIAISRYAQRFAKIFSAHQCYRTGDNELSAVIDDISMSAFTKIATDFVTMMHRDTPPIAVVGYAWVSHASISHSIVDSANSMMRADLVDFQDHYPMLSAGKAM